MYKIEANSELSFDKMFHDYGQAFGIRPDEVAELDIMELYKFYAFNNLEYWKMKDK
jgi:hypothetical protein